MKFGTLYSYWGNEWSCDYKKTAEKVAGIGFDILEIGAAHLLDMRDQELNDLKMMTRDLGLTLSANIGPPKEADIASNDSTIRNAGINFHVKIMNAMDRIDSRALVGAMYSYWPCEFDYIDKEKAWDISIASMKELAKIAEDHNISLCLEVLNRYETYILTDCAESIEYCKRIGSNNVKLLLDTFHMNIEEDDQANAIRLAGDMLGHLHVGESNRKLPGTCNGINWDEIGHALNEIGYDKGVVMEPFILSRGKIGNDIKVWRDLSNGADEKTMTQNISDSLVFLKSKFSSKKDAVR